MATLDKLALKKSSNNEVFDHMQKDLAAEMETEDFRSQNTDCFKSTPTKLDILIEKLRQKYSDSKRNGQMKQIVQKMLQDLIRRRNLKFEIQFLQKRIDH